MSQVAFSGEWKTGTSGSETSLTDFSTKVKSIKFSRNGETIDCTNLGSTGHKYVKGLTDADFDVEFFYDSTIWAQLHALLSDTTAISFAYGPEGTTTGLPKVSGTSMLQLNSIDENTAPGELKTISCKYKVSGSMSFGTY